MAKNTSETTGSELVLDGTDPVGALRAMPLADASALPQQVKGVRVLSAELKRTLSNIAAGNRAEAVKALRAVASRLESNPMELGDLVVSAAQHRRAADRLERSEEILQRLADMVALYESVSEVAQHDARRMLAEAQDEVTRRVDKGRVNASDYAAVTAYFDAEREAIAEGRKSAAKQRSDEPKPNG